MPGLSHFIGCALKEILRILLTGTHREVAAIVFEPPSANQQVALAAALGSLNRRLGRCQQLVCFDFEGARDLVDIVQRDIPSTPLDVSDKRPMKIAFERQVLLRQSMRGTQQPHVVCEHGSRGRCVRSMIDTHLADGGMASLLSQPLLRHNPDARSLARGDSGALVRTQGQRELLDIRLLTHKELRQ